MGVAVGDQRIDELGGDLPFDAPQHAAGQQHVPPADDVGARDRGGVVPVVLDQPLDHARPALDGRGRD